MDVLVKPHARETEVFGTVIDMPFPNILIIKTSRGTITVHESLVKKFF